MAASTEPRSGLFYGWALGENGWNTGMDANLLRLGRFGFHLSVKNRTQTAPPATPSAGDSYIIASGATGAWAGRDGALAVFDGSAWVYGTPRTGWRAYDEADDVSLVFKGGVWATDASGGSYTDEQVRDVIGAALAAGTGIAVTVNDGADTITIATNFDKARAYLNTATNTTTAGWQKVPVDTVEFDTNSIFDTTNKRFIPKKAGYYQVNLRARTGTTGTLVLGIGKNGTQVKAAGDDIGSAYALGGPTLIYCNGTTDYLEMFVYTTAARAYTTGSFDTFVEVFGPF